MEVVQAKKAKYIEDVAQNHPPYKWEIHLVGEDGTRMIIAQQDGSWVDAMYQTEQLRKQLGLQLMPPKNRLNRNHG